MRRAAEARQAKRDEAERAARVEAERQLELKLMSVGLELGLRAQILYDFPEVEPGAAIAKHSRSET